MGKRHLEPIQGGHYIIYQRPQNGAAGAWLARWYDPETRKQKQVRLGTADDFMEADDLDVLTFNQAQARARVWFKSCAHNAVLEAGGESVPTGPYKVADAIDDYLKDAERRGMKGLDRTVCTAKAHILPELGSIEVAKLTRGRIEKWHANIASSPKRRRSKVGAEKPAVAPAAKSDEEKRARKDTANRILTVLKAALNHAKDRGKVGDAAGWQVVKPFRNVSAARIRFLSAQEQVRLVNVCPPDFRKLVQAALFTGARYGELCRMLVRDFDSEGGTVLVAVSKGGKPRHIVLTKEGREWFAGQAAGRPAGELLFTRTGVQRRKRLEVSNGWGKSDQFRYMAAACEAAKIEELTFHELRHSYASLLIAKGVPLSYIAAQLGQADTRMVEKHYGHLQPNAMAKAIRKLAPRLGIGDKTKVATLKISANAG
jgi:integrase